MSIALSAWLRKNLASSSSSNSGTAPREIARYGPYGRRPARGERLGRTFAFLALRSNAPSAMALGAKAQKSVRLTHPNDGEIELDVSESPVYLWFRQ